MILFNSHAYKLEDTKRNEENIKEFQLTSFRDSRRQDYLNHDRTLSQTALEKEKQLIRNWKRTQNDKKERQIHDLRYELAVNKLNDLKDTYHNKIHEKQVSH